MPSVHEAAPLFLEATSVAGQPYVLYRSVKYSVPWDMCYSQAYYRVIADKLHIYDSKRRHVCTHVICPVKGSFQRLEEHRRETGGDWLDSAERMREKWNCTEFQRFVNAFRKANSERELPRQLSAVERYLDEKRPSRSLVARVMSICCRDDRCRYTQFKTVFEAEAARDDGLRDDRAGYPASVCGVESRDLGGYQRAFEERCAS